MTWTIPRFGPVSSARADVRFHELDGLRGWAALSVVLFHIFWETFGQIYPPLRNPLTQALFDGDLAVAVFFVLSGEALSSGYFNGRGRRAVISLALRRYPRLAIPVLASCAIVAALMMSGQTFHSAAAEIIRRPDWMGGWLNWTATVPRLLDYGLYHVFAGERAQDAFNPFLWTMKLEFFGSIVVFVLLLSLHRRGFGFPLVAALAAATLALSGQGAYAGCFLFGMLFAALRAHGAFERVQQSRWMLGLSSAGLILLAAVNGLTTDVPTPLFAVILTGVIFANAPACRFLANAPSRFLGKISFPLYLMQFPVLISYTAWAIVTTEAHGGLTPASIFGIGLSSLALCLLAAVAFLPVEWLTTWVGRRLSAMTLDPFVRHLPAPGAALGQAAP